MDRFTKLIESFKEHMKENPDVECCGIITKDFSYVPSKNLSSRPADSFVLNPTDLVKYWDNCWGIFHSHPLHHDDLPSEEDKNSAFYKDYKFVVGNLNGSFYQYWLNDHNMLEFKDFNEESLVC